VLDGGESIDGDAIRTALAERLRAREFKRIDIELR
jgi:hypothetical protein